MKAKKAVGRIMNSNHSDPNILAARINAVNKESERVPIDCGHFDIRIRRDGRWYYRGSEIKRKPLIKLFSSVLKRDSEGQFWLETPVEKGRIDVDDAPFLAVTLEVTGKGPSQILTFYTNLDQIVTVDSEHPIRVETDPITEEPSPYVAVSGTIDALIARSIFYQLVDLAVSYKDDKIIGVWSSGLFFELGSFQSGIESN